MSSTESMAMGIRAVGDRQLQVRERAVAWWIPAWFLWVIGTVVLAFSALFIAMLWHDQANRDAFYLSWLMGVIGLGEIAIGARFAKRAREGRSYAVADGAIVVCQGNGDWCELVKLKDVREISVAVRESIVFDAYHITIGTLERDITIGPVYHAQDWAIDVARIASQEQGREIPALV